MNNCERRFDGGLLVVTNIGDEDVQFMKKIEQYTQLLNQLKVYGTVEVTLADLTRRLNAKLTSIA
ncbi:hypothetical protein PUW24_00895 (plasmid) [Paenibacillus urinalis]|uniref:Uncharacterized protein n=2 Tax=Paenibacillus TaxID=44249 RepID=A0AAX3N6R8_9BACL|nr:MULTISPECIES: hypothetical protein [Paenibacillus]MCM3130529.1 hypothetical protein [Paenibacillus sp. MER 78]WDH85415.1 hypothetical protein PUW23_25600 [Paenibacillus urinalis]WDH95147.1 hypothetical protein PUW24_00895 [Paenibacillus urinalis]WDI05381.1 hypothetical protein PUW25_26680 [Paenibacillus urinalis]SDX62979.1 hypothetical protein SAMN05518848_11080 [Paenibacillus sp. PDC88]